MPVEFAESEYAKLTGEIRQTRRVATGRPLIEAAKRQVAKQILRLKYEGLAMYVPLPLGERAHACNAVWRLIGDSNRAGKSLWAGAESSRALCGVDPYNKYPKTGGFALFVGLKLDHINLMYRTMFMPGAYKVIEDEHARMWRAVAWDPNCPSQLMPYDEAYREKWRDAPPLVPPRLIESIAMEDAKKDIPRRIKMRNGWHSLWLSALGDPDQGSHYNLVHFDEEMPNSDFYLEAHRGLTRLHEIIDQRPKGIWSATSQVANVELAELRERAEADPDSDHVQRFKFLIDDNPYFSPEARASFMAGLREEERQTRYFGIPALDVRRVYIKYNPNGDSATGSGHGCEPFVIDPSKVARFIFLDPGITKCATLMASVDEDEEYITIYDGFVIKNCTARMWAHEVAIRQNGYKFEAAVCDKQMGSQGLMHRERVTVAQEYFAALKEEKIQLRQRGPLNGFFPSCSDVDGRTQSLLRLMEIRGGGPFEGTCRLRIMRGVLPELDKQIRRAATDPKNPDKRYKHKNIPQDLLDDLEYAAAFDPRWAKPVPLEEDETRTPATIAFDDKKKRERFAKARRYRRFA